MNPNTYFGLPGQLMKLYDPTGGMLATRDIGTSTFITGNFGARVDKAYGGNRTYVLNYGALGRDSFEALNRFQQGHMGPGPFVLIDPGRRNLLTVNQSSGTSASNDTREFTVAGIGGSLSSDPSLVTPFPKTLKWSFSTTSPGVSTLTLDKPSKLSTWYGIPVINQPYVFYFMVIGGPIDLTATVTWFTATGGVAGTNTMAITTSATAWKMPYVMATPPAGAIWAGLSVVGDAITSSISAGEFLNFSSFMFHEGTSPELWAGGTGIYPVQVVGLPEKYGFAESGMLVAPTLTLQEVR